MGNLPEIKNLVSCILYTQLFTLTWIHYLNLLIDFSNTSSINLFHLIHFTVILMITTHVNFHDREVKSSMPYFGVFTFMFLSISISILHTA